MNATKNPNHEFAFGSGHLNPVKAIDPGLVYETGKEDYINMLYGAGYGVEEIRSITGDKTISPQVLNKILQRDLNYPSMTALVPFNQSFTIKFHRTVTYAATGNSTYKANVFVAGSEIKVEVVPQVLSFYKSLREKKSFEVTVTGEGLKDKQMVSAYLEWVAVNGIHNVRSPIIVYHK